MIETISPCLSSYIAWLGGKLTSSTDTRSGNPEQNLITLELVGLGGSALDGFTLLGSLEDFERRHDGCVCCGGV